MTISINRKGDFLTVAPEGRLDANTSPELREMLGKTLVGIKHLTFDFGQLSYISSAGLRVLMEAQNTMNGQGEMKLIHVQGGVLDILRTTGFLNVLNIE